MRRLCAALLLAVVAAAPAAGPPAPKKNPNEAIQEIAGSAEFLKQVPKKFALIQGIDVTNGKVTLTLLADGEKEAKDWAMDPEAEVKRDGWWGRVEQFKPGDRVWAWFKTDRKKQPTAIFMLCDAVTAQDIHLAEWTVTEAGGTQTTVKPKKGDPVTVAQRPLFGVGSKVFVVGTKDKPALVGVTDFERQRQEQKAWLRKEWEKDGLPGTLAYVHYHGEAELHLDHETMRWGRSLTPGTKVELVADPPIKAVVKSMAPLRERTALKLVVNGADLGELKPGQRVHLKMPTPPVAVEESVYPPDIDLKRTRAERIEWFLASTYCTCPVGKDTCTGHFYTLASCNPNGCGSPKLMRETVAAKIDKGLTDRQIYDELLKERGPGLVKPHLLP